MNYIKRLEAENKVLNDFIDELKKHLCLPKFNRPNNYINTMDLWLRLTELFNQKN